MDHHEQRVLPRGVVIGRLDQYAFDGRAVLGFPLHHFTRGEAEILVLGGDIGEVSRHKIGNW